MSIDVKLNEANGIVDVIYHGTATLEERKKGIDKLSSLYSQLQPLAILIDVRELEMDLTSAEQKLFGAYLANYSKLAHARVAVLHKENHNPNFLVDTYVVITGARKRAQFTNYEQACTWLKRE